MVKMLDCTLRDGAYIVDAEFGSTAITGIISKLEEAGIEIIECGWLKDKEHIGGTSFYHVPEDLLGYLKNKNRETIYTAMIDWDRYDVGQLPVNDGRSLDAIRVVFPYNRFREGIAVGCEILKKGYKVFFQAANTLAYSKEDLIALANELNSMDGTPEGLSIVDTFGAMYEEDLTRISEILDKHLDRHIRLGFHSHNNQQLSYALTMAFIKKFKDSDRDVIIDASLCGMGRGAGNTTTELAAGYLNKLKLKNYDMDAILDAIDIYMTPFLEKYKWGYSTPYFLAGVYCCHVNNIAYLQKNHRCNSKDMRNVIESMEPEDRCKYDYDLLEEKYIENQDRKINDDLVMGKLKSAFADKKVVLIAPGRSSVTDINKIKNFIKSNSCIVIAVNALLADYEYDYLFLTNKVRYDYAETAKSDQFVRTPRILLSNIKISGNNNEYIVNFNRAIKRGWEHFDNAVICCLRLLNRMRIEDVYIAGFDGFKHKYNESYADASLPTLNPDNRWDELNEEIKDMFRDVKQNSGDMNIHFLTETIYDE